MLHFFIAVACICHLCAWYVTNLSKPVSCLSVTVTCRLFSKSKPGTGLKTGSLKKDKYPVCLDLCSFFVTLVSCKCFNRSIVTRGCKISIKNHIIINYPIRNSTVFQPFSSFSRSRISSKLSLKFTRYPRNFIEFQSWSFHFHSKQKTFHLRCLLSSQPFSFDFFFSTPQAYLRIHPW